MADLSEVMAAFGAQFGKLDNETGKWAAQEEELAAFFPQISAALSANFPPDSTPLMIYEQARSRYQNLLVGLDEQSRGYLNLRFFIMLNGFLSACQESLQKAALNESLDPAELVAKSYFTPFFFERAAQTTEDARRMIETDLEQLQSATRDKSGVRAADRIRKGTVSFLTETYCPAHPALYPLVATLESINLRVDPAFIDEVGAALSRLEAALR